jgi:hypothetical protein
MDSAPRQVSPPAEQSVTLKIDKSNDQQRRVIEYLTPFKKYEYVGKLKIFHQIIGSPIDRATFQSWRRGHRRIPLWAAKRILARLESEVAILAELVPIVRDHIQALEKAAYKPKPDRTEKEL